MKNRVLRILIIAGLVMIMTAACGRKPSGGDKVTEEVSPTATTEVTETPIPTEKPTATPTTRIPTPTAIFKTPTPTPTNTPTPTPTMTPTPTLGADFRLGIDKLPAAQLPKVDGALALEPFYDAIFAELMGLPVEDAKMFLPCNNTPQAYENLTNGKVDMIFCALPSNEQVKAAKDAGVEFEYHTVLSGGFVFFVNRDNPVDSITQEQLKELSKRENICVLAGHYEGVDQRVIDELIDEEISIGDYVLTGGELPALVFIDALSRLAPGVLSNDECFTEESHYKGLLEYPQYTKPQVWRGREVPAVLYSGDHRKVDRWRYEHSLINTAKKRPDMLRRLELSEDDKRILDECIE